MKKIKKILISKLKWIIGAIFIIIFIFIAHALLQDNLHQIDNIIYKNINKLKSNSMTFIFKFISNLSNSITLITITICTLIFHKNKNYGKYMLINLICIVVINQILKLSFGRTRPLDLMLIDEIGYSFPSGHSMASMGFYGYIIYLIYKDCKNKKWLYIILLSLLIMLVGISRIYLGVHYASDVIAGFSITICYLIIYTSIISSKLEIDKIKK